MTEQNLSQQEKIQIRSEEEVNTAFRELAEDFPSQGEAFRALVNTYKEQLRTQKLPDQKGQIDQIDANLKSIKNLFINALEAYSSAKSEIAVDFENEISALKESISVKDEDIKNLKESLKDKDNSIKSLQEDLKAQKTEIELLDNLKSQVKDKDLQIGNFRQEIENYKISVEDKERKINVFNEQILKLKNEVITKIDEINRLKTDAKLKDNTVLNQNEKISDLKSQIDEIKALNEDLRVGITEKDKYIKELNKTLLELNLSRKSNNQQEG